MSEEHTQIINALEKRNAELQDEVNRLNANELLMWRELGQYLMLERNQLRDGRDNVEEVQT